MIVKTVDREHGMIAKKDGTERTESILTVESMTRIPYAGFALARIVLGASGVPFVVILAIHYEKDRLECNTISGAKSKKDRISIFSEKSHLYRVFHPVFTYDIPSFGSTMSQGR